MKSDDVDGYLQVESLPFGEIINKASPVNIPHIRSVLSKTHYKCLHCNDPHPTMLPTEKKGSMAI